MCEKLLFVLYEIFFIVLLHMQEADDVPIWNKDSEEKDEIDRHFNTEDLHKVGELDETKGEEEHIEWELVWQNDLIVAVENGHPHDFWIDTKAERNVCERCGECGADGQWRENEVNEYAQRPNGKEDNGETLSFEVWHESIANHLTNTKVGADGTNAHAGSNENDEWKIGVFDIVCGANVKAWDVGKHWHKGKDPCNVDAVDGLSEQANKEKNADDESFLFLCIHWSEFGIFSLEPFFAVDVGFWLKDFGGQPEHDNVENKCWCVVEKEVGPGDTDWSGDILTDAVNDESVWIEDEIVWQEGCKACTKHDAGCGATTFEPHSHADAISECGQWNGCLSWNENVKDQACKSDAPDDAFVAATGKDDALIGDAFEQSDRLQHIGEDEAADHHPRSTTGPWGEHSGTWCKIGDDVGDRQKQSDGSLIDDFCRKQQNG